MTPHAINDSGARRAGGRGERPRHRVPRAARRQHLPAARATTVRRHRRHATHVSRSWSATDLSRGALHTISRPKVPNCWTCGTAVRTGVRTERAQSGSARTAVRRILTVDEIPLADYLTHCTRGADGPWPDQDRAEYLDSLILGRPDAAHSALAALTRIVQQRRLLATGRAIRGGTPVVCFTAVGIAELGTSARSVPIADDGISSRTGSACRATGCSSGGAAGGVRRRSALEHTAGRGSVRISSGSAAARMAPSTGRSNANGGMWATWISQVCRPTPGSCLFPDEGTMRGRSQA